MGEERGAIRTASILTAAGVGALALYAGILGVKYLLSRSYARSHPEESRDDGEVTVMQPILSGDPFLEGALKQNLEQTRATARFLWLVDDDDAEGLRVTQQLAAKAEGRAAVLICPPAGAEENPKTAKLQYALAAITTPYVAVLDDDTMLTPDHLGRARFALETCTLYTGLPCYLQGPNFWSSLVSHFVNNNSIMTYLPLLPLIGPLTINGMFYVMRTESLKEMGGFSTVVSQLCDDYAVARLVRAHGGVIRQGITSQFLRTTVPDSAQYIRLMHRWFVFANVLVRDQPLRVQLLLFLFLGLPPILLWAGMLSLAGGLAFSALLAVTLLVRHVALRSLHRQVYGNLPHFHWLTSIVAELLQPLHWLHACLQHTLRWRTRRIRLDANGTFSLIGGPA